MTDYASAYEYHSFARIPQDDIADDTEIGFALLSAKAAIDLATNRSFDEPAEDATERTYLAYFNKSIGRYQLDIDDVQDTTDLTVELGSTDLTADATLAPRNAAAKGMPYTTIIFSPGAVYSGAEITVTALFGWTTVPTAIKNATLLQANRLMKRRDAPFGVAGSPDLGSELRLLAKLDPDVDVLIRPYIRWWGAV